MKTWILMVLALSFSTATALALPSAPQAKPSINYVSRVVGERDAAYVQRALRAADKGEWSRVQIFWRETLDAVAADLILWRLATSGAPNLSFDVLDQAATRLQDWPDHSRILRHAESAINRSALSHNERIAWLESRGPSFGAGKVALADAYRARGNRTKANEIIKDVWRHHALPRDEARRVLQRYGSALNQQDHRARADLLLWIGQRSAARDLRGQLSSGHRALLDARIALAARARGVDQKVAAVPQSLRDHPGLLYERAKWRRRKRVAGATDLLVRINGNDVPEPARDILWRERNIALQRALKDRDYDIAYALAAPHGMTRGAEFAEAEWSAGWIALRLQGRAALALKHFETLKTGVSRPISQARAEYWRGRALAKLDLPNEAEAAFEMAARYKHTYYGQLAAERIGQTQIYFQPAPAPTPEDRAAFQARAQVKALTLLAEAGNNSLFRKFSYHLDDQLERQSDHELLSEVARRYHKPDVGIRGAKAGLANGIVAPNAAYPIISYKLSTQPRIENAFVLALSRQESELNPRAISHANARGLMQLLPRTARDQARREGLPYRTSWLTDDPAYNVSLGAAHLDDLLDRFNGSYIMAAAAYNAGASRPARWVKEYGDPRLGEIDPIDWVEFIPFSETRNYVQRILENVQVYRHRLSGNPQDIRLTEDLNRGALR